MSYVPPAASAPAVEKTSRSDLAARAEKRAAAARHAAREDLKKRIAPNPNWMMPHAEREQHGQEIGTEEMILTPARTRPVYCDRAHQVEQRVVTPAETQRVMRIISPVEQMRRRGAVSDEAAHWAAVWHKDWALAAAGYRSCLAGGVGREPSGLSEAVVIAASELRQAAAALGKFGHRVVTELVGEEMSIQQMAELHGLNRQEMTGICKAVIERLVEYYTGR